MICEPCRLAGSYNAIRSGQGPTWLVTSPQRHAAKLHADCEQPETCPCQHHTGGHINRGQPR